MSRTLTRHEGTRRTYAAGWRRFAGWCEREAHIALPAHPVTVAAYLVDAADTPTEAGERAYAAAAFGIWIATINHQHRTTGRLSPGARARHRYPVRDPARVRRGESACIPRDTLLVDDVELLIQTARTRAEVASKRSSNAATPQSDCWGSP
jgi:hypothetical protein